jgi:nucleoid-associated protein YgaU
MPDSLMEPLEPYEPQTSYDWDPEEEPARESSNVLWGRIAFFGLALLLAFIIGRISAPNGISESQLKEANAEITSLKADNEDLKSQLAEAQAAATAQPSPDASTSPDTEVSPSPDTGGDATVTGEEYVVQRGDTLNTISEKFYGDTKYGDYLADVNNIDDPSALTIGMTLTIPDESELPD